MGEADDPELRDEVDVEIEEILINDSLNMIENDSQRVVQLTGSTAQRLGVLTTIVSS